MLLMIHNFIDGGNRFFKIILDSLKGNFIISYVFLYLGKHFLLKNITFSVFVPIIYL